MGRGTCRVTECTNLGHTRQLCHAHYRRFRLYGDPAAIKTMQGEPPEVRFWAKVDKKLGDGCWLWTGATNRGYGAFTPVAPGPQLKAHRYAYELEVGPIPDGLQIDHLCRTPLCVNPAHMEPVTSRVNTLRGDTFQAANLAKTHCVNGHEFTPENTLVRKPSPRLPNGGRWCRTCNREKMRRRRGSSG